MILLRLLKNNRAGGTIVIFLLLALQWGQSIVSPPEATKWTTMPLYHMIFEPLVALPHLSVFVAFLIFSAIAILLVRLNVKYFLIEDRSFMPAAMFILIAGTFPGLHQLNPMLIGTLFLLITIIILFNAQEDNPDSFRIFNASLVLGIGSMFYLDLIWFIPMVWITILIVRPLRWRELLYPIVVIAMIALFFVTYYWVALDDMALLAEVLLANLSLPSSYTVYENSWLILTAYLLLIIIIASIYALRHVAARKIVIRKLYQVFFVMFLYAILYDLIFTKLRVESFYILALPVAYLLSNFFHRKRNHWMHELLLWVWIGIIVYIHIKG
jgi:hypothetical protein